MLRLWTANLARWWRQRQRRFNGRHFQFPPLQFQFQRHLLGVGYNPPDLGNNLQVPGPKIKGKGRRKKRKEKRKEEEEENSENLVETGGGKYSQ